MRIAVERTFLTTAEGRCVIPQISSRFTVESLSLRNAILDFITREDGRMLGSINENDHRAVCTAWTCGRLYLLVAEIIGD